MKFLFFYLSLFSFFFLEAQTCCSGGVPLSNSLGLPILKKKTFQLGVLYDYNNLNTLNIGSEKVDDNSRLRTTHSVLVNLGYAVTNDLSVEGLFTWVNQRREITQFGNVNLDKASGIGDAIILAKYKFKNIFSKNNSLILGLGGKIPVGSITEKNESGIVLNADLQPGSNAWDIIYWFSLSRNFNFRPSFNISLRAIYRNTGINDSYLDVLTYKFGNEFQTYLNFTDEFLIFKSLLESGISLKYRSVTKDEIDGFMLDNTGGNWFSLIPNLSTKINKSISILAKAELPIYNNVDGTQLTPTFRITAGVLLQLNNNKKDNFYKNNL